ncbi:MAG: ATP-binding protein, partial [Holophagales bacterium]|nr:ATP-binding protein [Holophagales bacterium]
MHERLSRQLARYLEDPGLPEELVAAIDRAYHQADLDQEHLRRSMEETSRELLQRNEQLRLEVEERARASDELRRTSRRQAFEVDLAAALTRSQGLEETARNAVRTAADHLDAGLAALWILERSGQHLQLLSSHGPVRSIDVGLARLERCRGPFAEMLASAEPLRIEGISDLSHLARSAWLEPEGLVGFVGQPLEVEARVVGVMGIFVRKPLVELACEALGAVASTMALALERKRAELGRETTLSLLRATLEATAEGIAVTDGQGRLTVFNQRFCEIWGLDPTTVETGSQEGGQRVLEQAILRLGNRQDLHDLIARAREDPELETSLELKLVDGRILELITAPQRAGGRAGGEPVGRVVSFRDVTEPRRLEQQMRQAQKMEAVGRLAGGIAHDFNNLLTVIKGYCSLVNLELRDTPHLQGSVAEIARAADQAADLTTQLLAYSRQQVMEPRLIDLNETVADLRKMLERVIGEVVELQLELAAEPAAVLADRGQLQQVVLNLVINARDAMPDGGEIHVATRNFEIDETFAGRFDYPVARGPMVLLEVRDTGIGMDEEIRARIFEPFFTTKDVGKGSGLGLSTAYGIVKQTGGYIFVDSDQGKGAKFSIFLPRYVPDETADAEGRSPGPEGEKSRDLTGVGTVLLVEDEDAVRMFSARALRNKGYTVLEAQSGEAAMEVLGNGGNEIDLLITDV